MTQPRRPRSYGRARVASRPVGRTASLVWAGISASQLTNVVAGSKTLVEIVDQTADDIAGATLIRTIGSLTIVPGAVSGNVFFRAGIMIMNDDAVGSGVSPGPWVDPASWMWEASDVVRCSDLFDNAQFWRASIDIRVKRRMPQLENSLVFIIDNLAGSATSLNFALNIKALLRVP